MNATGEPRAAGPLRRKWSGALVQGSVLHLSAQLFLMLCTYCRCRGAGAQPGPGGVRHLWDRRPVADDHESVGRFGVPQASGKLMAEPPARRPHRRERADLVAPAYLVLFAGMWLAAPAIAAIFEIPEGAGLLRLAFWDIPIYGAFFVLWHILNARRRFLIESTSFVLYALTKVVGISILVWIGPTLRDAFIVNIASSLVAALFIGWFVGRMPWRFSLAESRRIMQLAMPIGILTIGLQLLPTIDLWMLSAIGSHPDDAVRGYYVAAPQHRAHSELHQQRLERRSVTSIASAMGTGDRVAVQRAMEMTVRFLLVALLPAGALIAVNAREILTLLFSPEFAPAAPLLAVLGFAQGVCMTSFGTLLSIMTGGRQAKTASRLAMGWCPSRHVESGRRVAVRCPRRSGREPPVVRDRSRRARSYFSGASTARSHAPASCCASSWRRSPRGGVGAHRGGGCGCWSSSSSSASSTWQRCRCSASLVGATSRCFAVARLQARVAELPPRPVKASRLTRSSWQ